MINGLYFLIVLVYIFLCLLGELLLFFIIYRKSKTRAKMAPNCYFIGLYLTNPYHLNMDYFHKYNRFEVD